jgi:hypothetical protein
MDFLNTFENLLCHVFSRHSGVSNPPYDSLNVRFKIGDKDENVIENRKIIAHFLNTECENLVSLDQTHSDKVLKVSKPLKDEIHGYDAMITDKRGIYLMIQIADCQAVCVYDPVKEVIANIHNGWKGSSKNIVGKTVNKMKEEYGSSPKDLFAFISPSLGPCHSKFSNPDNELPGHLHKYIDSKERVNFWQATKDQLINEGVTEKNIEISKVCTACNTDKYFSYRSENKTTGRFAVVIGMPV